MAEREQALRERETRLLVLEEANARERLFARRHQDPGAAPTRASFTVLRSSAPWSSSVAFAPGSPAALALPAPGSYSSPIVYTPGESASFAPRPSVASRGTAPSSGPSGSAAARAPSGGSLGEVMSMLLGTWRSRGEGSPGGGPAAPTGGGTGRTDSSRGEGSTETNGLSAVGDAPGSAFRYASAATGRIAPDTRTALSSAMDGGRERIGAAVGDAISGRYDFGVNTADLSRLNALAKSGDLAAAEELGYAILDATRPQQQEVLDLLNDKNILP